LNHERTRSTASYEKGPKKALPSSLKSLMHGWRLISWEAFGESFQRLKSVFSEDTIALRSDSNKWLYPVQYHALYKRAVSMSVFVGSANLCTSFSNSPEGNFEI
jgi:hypothetical protein